MSFLNQEAVGTMLNEYNLPNHFWAKVINIACYIQNRVLLNKYQLKTP